MPPNEDALESIARRVRALEQREIKVKDLPVDALKREFNKQPINPVDMLLPHSIGTDLLKTTNTYIGYQVASNVLFVGSSEALFAVPGIGIAAPVEGNYRVSASGDSDGIGCYMVLYLSKGGVPTGQSIVGPGTRAPQSIDKVYYGVAAGEIFGAFGQAVGGTATPGSGGHLYTFDFIVEKI